MKKTSNKLIIFIICVLLFSILSGYSQSKYGKTTMEEMKMTSYEPDTTASAVILLKDGKVNFKYNELYGFQYEYTVAVKIKILKQEGLKYCDHNIFYTQIRRGLEEVITSLSGNTYNLENGKIEKTKLSKEHIFDSSQDDQIMQKKFTMPAAKVGSIIEYKYTIQSDFTYELRDFEFQNYIPTAYVCFDITLPEWFKYNINQQGYEVPIPKRTPINESFYFRVNSGHERISCLADNLHYVGKNLTALKNEGFIWTLNDYKSKVTFELQSTQFPYSMIRFYSSRWKDIDELLMKDSRFGGNLNRSGLFKDDIEKGEISINRAAFIESYIKNKVKWNKKDRLFAENSLKKVLEEGTGNSAEMNLLLLNALKAGGFEAYPVVISTRSNGRIPIANPSVTALNNVLVAIKIDDAMYITDASAKYGTWNLLPEDDMVPQARIFEDQSSRWIDLTQVSNGVQYTNAIYKFVDNELQGDITIERKGNSAYDFRTYFFNQHESKEDYIEKLGTRLSAEIKEFELDGEQNTSSSVKETFKTIHETSLDDDFIYINPMQIKHLSDNPLKNEKRIFPIQFDYLKGIIQIVTLEVPEGYMVEELPQSTKYTFGENNDLTFLYRISQSGNKVILHYQFKQNTLMVLPNSYDALKEFYAKIVSKSSEQIVLKKAEEQELAQTES